MTVYLVGAGPGDPGLITVRGRSLVERAEVLVYDRLAGEPLLDLAPPPALLIDAGKSPERVAMTQDEINACLVEHGLAGRRVVRLKGGDPFVFGRGGEEAIALREAGVPCEVVPGLSSSIAVPAFAGIPVTQRGLAAQFAVITGHQRPGKERSEIDWDVLARFPGTLVFLMAAARLELIADALIAAGKDPATPAAVAQSGTTAAQRAVVSTLARLGEDAAAAGIGPPAVCVVGPVAALRSSIAWAEQRPLHGRLIGVTRPREQASRLAERLRELGAEVIEAPTIRTEAIAGPALDPRAWDVLCLTSPTAVPMLVERIGGDVRRLAHVRIAAIGPGTAAALRAVGVVADVVPGEAVGEALAAALAPEVRGRRVVIARAEQARDALPEALAAAGAEVEIEPLYRTLPIVPRNPQRLLAADAVCFTSASTVHAFCTALAGHDLSAVRGVSIGPVTSSAARERGVPIVAEAARHDLDGLIRTLEEM